MYGYVRIAMREQASREVSHMIESIRGSIMENLRE